MIVRAYNETFGMPIIITRCSNNYSPYQFPEKLVPLMINKCLKEKDLSVYGDGMQVRDWLHVSDHCSAIDTFLLKGIDGEAYNIGGNNEKANIEIVKLIIGTLGKSEGLIKYVEDRPGHNRRYSIDNTKITTELGWEPAFTFKQGMKGKIQWYLENTWRIENIISSDYANYYDKIYTGVQKLTLKHQKNSPKLPKIPFNHISKFWKFYMRLRSNKGYIQGELNLVDRHDYFEAEIGNDCNFSDLHSQFETMISSERERAFLEAEMSVF